MRSLLPILLLAGCSALDADPFEEAKALAARDLKDPASAQFRKLERFGSLVCGEINARNSYGGYVGFEPFLVEDGVATLASNEIAAAVPNVDSVLKRCSKAKWLESGLPIKQWEDIWQETTGDGVE